MKNIEVIQTLRLYDADFIIRLGTLMQREEENFKNKNEFMTELLKRGYESYIAAMRETDGESGKTATSAVREKSSSAGADAAGAAEGGIRGIYLYLSEMNDYITLQFRIIEIYHEIYQKMLSAIYRMQLSNSGGEKASPASIEAGFFDDLPARFDKLIVSLKTQFGF